jgi:putative FmdB family regulatory protein
MIYEYRCQQCGTLFDVRATMAEKESGLHPRCPNCGSDQVVRRFSALSVLRGARGGGAAAGPGSEGGCCQGGGAGGRAA